jgi:tetratricopeptide (TPR) repeat protein
MKWLNYLFLPALVACSCNQKDKRTDFSGLLKQPPYSVYSDSIGKEPKRADLYFSRGKLLSSAGQFAAAVADFEQSWQLAPTDVYGWYYGGALINLQRYDSAIGVLKKAGAQFPANLSIKERLAYTYNLTKKPGEALAVYDEIIQRDSTDFRSWAAKAYIYQDEEKDSLALACFKKSYSIMPMQVVGEEVAFMLAQNKSPECIPFCNLLISRDSAKISVQPYYCKGLYYKNTGNTTEAIKLFDYCMKTDYAFPDPFLDKGEILYDQKKYDEAIKIFQLVKNNNNTYADAYFWIGKCYEAQGKKQEAALEYERAVALDKDFKEAKEGMARMKN